MIRQGMTRGFLLLFLALGGGLLACAKGDEASGDNTFAGSDAASDVDLASMDDGGGSSPGEGGTCQLGTANDCGKCGASCPASATDPMTAMPTCTDATSAGTCDITCTGEHYDLDGKPANGCEAADLPIQDTPLTAVAVALADANPQNMVAPLYGDKRKHDTDQAARDLGREDWFKVTATGAGAAGVGMGACLSAGNFPSDDVLEVCITTDGSTTTDPSGCASLTVANDGGGSSCVSPGGLTNVDSGTFYVRVRRTAGSANANQYALYLRH